MRLHLVDISVVYQVEMAIDIIARVDVDPYILVSISGSIRVDARNDIQLKPTLMAIIS